MSANEKISRLQGLLERVQMRAAQPRAAGAVAVAAVHAAPVARAVPAATPTPAPYIPPADPTPVPSSEPAFAAPAMDLEMMPAAADTTSSSPPPPTVDYDIEADVEVSSEVVEVEIDIDEPMALESGAQPVAHQTTPPGELEEELEEPMIAAPVAELEEVIEEPAPANEIEEPTPSSSRRPIAGEEPVVEAYGEESAPLHTPPPESGKQVSASNPPSARPPSMPPPSLEGHTLIGGWREPGLGPQIGAGPGAPVRVPGPAQSAAEPPAPAVAAQPSGTRLSPDVTRPNLAATANIAAFSGAEPVAKPKTLGELIDLTLGL